ncbi:MAG: HD domain-containing protein [Fibrobacter sp.]|nr:HD domain-containing protein [Fibrobacter sp.]
MRKYVLTSWLKNPLDKLKGLWVRSKSVILLIIIGLLLNVIPAKIALAFDIPLYLDCLGTVLTAMLGGAMPAVIVGFGVNVINGFAEPVAMYYGVLSVLIAIFATFFFRWGYFKKAWKLLVVIFTFALIGGGLGSVFTYALYGFNFGEGISAPFAIAFHDVMHWNRFVSQLLADFVLDVFDKSAIVVLATLLFHYIPQKHKDELKKIYNDPSSNAMNRMVRHSLLSKVVMIVMVAEILLGGLASTIGFLLYRTNSVNNFISIGKGVTEAASVAIDAEKVDDYVARGYEVEGYQKTRDMLERIRGSFPQTKYVYVYKIKNDGCHVVFDLDTDGEPGGSPGEVIDFDPTFKPYLPTLLEGGEIDPIISDDQYGWLLTVYRPLRNAAGKTVAYVAADISMESIIRDEATFFIKLLSLFFGLSIIIMGIVIEVMKRGVVIPVNKMSLAAYKYSLDIGLASGIDFETEAVDLDGIQNSANRIGRIGISTNDEIGMLYDSFNGMAQSSFEFIKQVQEQNDRIRRMQEVIIMEFAEMVEARDKSTGDHIKKTAEYVEAIAKELQAEGKFKGVLTDAYIHKLKRAAPLHDIGKIAVSDLILNKNGKLTDEEFAIMKSHTTEGGKILKKIVADAGDTFDANYLNESIEMASYHHEKWDGSGYPTHIKGDEIPLSARIMAVADVFDALIAERVYKKGFSYEKAMSIITEGAGKHFDPDVVEAFTKISEKLYLARTRVTPAETETPEQKV